jgi:hypothetical protein
LGHRPSEDDDCSTSKRTSLFPVTDSILNQLTSSHLVSLEPMLISYLHLGLPSCLFPSEL